jgi:tetratricopeptide (TPR) repeat protein
MSLHARATWIFLAAVLVSAPLYFGGVTPAYSLAASVLAALLAFGAMFRKEVPGRRELPAEPALALGLALLALALAGAFSQNRRISVEDAVYWMALASVFCLAAFVCNDLKFWEKLALGLVVVAAGTAFWGLWNWLLGVQQVWGVVVDPILRGTHGTFVNRNHFAGYLSLAFPFSLVLLVQARTLPARILLALCGATIGAGIVFSLSRGAWVATGVSLLGMGVMAAARRKEERPRRWIMLVPAVLLLGLLLRIGLEPVFLRLERSATAEQVESIGSRLEIWKSAAAMFAHYPVAGAGPGLYGWLFPAFRPPGLNGHAWYAHCDYLQVLAEGGLVAGLAGAWLLVALYRLLAGGFWNSRRSAKRQLFLATLTGLLAACVEIGFDFQMHCFAFAFTLAVLLGAAAGNASRKKSIALPRLAFAPALLAAAMAFHLWIAALPLERARQQLAGEQPSRGLASLGASLALDPLNAEAHFDRGEFWAGRTRSGLAKHEAFFPAWQSYQAAIGNFPQGGLFWLRAGMLLEAGWQLGQVPLSGPRMAPVLRAMVAAEAAPARGTGPLPGKILAYYRRALERDPHNPYFHDVIAVALLRQGRPAEARRHVEESIFLEPELASHAIFLPYFGDAEFRRIARSALRRSLAQQPRQPGIHRMLARWDLEEGRIDAARRELALAGVGESGEGDPEWTGIAAELAIRQGRVAEGKSLWRRYCASGQWSRASLDAAVRFFVAQRRPETALEFLAETRSLPDPPEYLGFLEGTVYEQLGRKDAAIASYEFYRRHFPDDRTVLERLAGLYNSTGDPLRAEEAIRRIMRVYPGEPLLYLHLGRALLAQQAADQAVQELLVAVSLFPDEAPLWEFLGELQERQQHYRPAAETYDQLCRLRPSERHYALKAARCYYLAGERESSLRIYRRLLADNPSDPDVRREFQTLKF